MRKQTKFEILAEKKKMKNLGTAVKFLIWGELRKLIIMRNLMCITCSIMQYKHFATKELFHLNYTNIIKNTVTVL